MWASADQIARRALALLAASLLAGCAAGPDFVRPQAPSDRAYLPSGPPAPTEPAEGVRQAFAPGAEVSPAWWRLFNSAGLDRAMDEALVRNATLQSAQASLRESEENLRAGHGVFYPQLDLGFSAVRQRAAPLQSGISALRGVFNIFTLNGVITYLLDLAGSSRRTVEGLAAQADFQRNEMLATWLSLSGNIANTFIARAAYAEQIRATRELVARETQQRDIARAQVQGGSAPYANVLAIDSQLASTRATLPVLEQHYDQATHLLATLVGRTPGLGRAPDVALAQLALPRELPLTLPSELVRRRPDILSAEAQLHVASANLGVASAALFPTVTLSANYGTEGQQIEHITGPNGRFWSTGAVVDIPLFHGGTLIHQRNAAAEDWRRALADYRQAVLAAFAQVADALTALEHDAAALQAQAEALAAARQSAALVGANYEAGLVGYLDVLVADAQLHRAQIDHAQALALRLQDSAALYLALGGGWWRMPADRLRGAAP
jgi:NodT family efflux transporter outer membrane factor (OMF) lipoprotein